MPSSQGVLPWPAEGPFRVALAEESELPLTIIRSTACFSSMPSNSASSCGRC